MSTSRLSTSPLLTLRLSASRLTTLRLTTLLIAGFVATSAARSYADVEKVFPFVPGEVRLLNGPFKKAQELDAKFLLSLDADRLLHNFRVNAGLPSTAQPLGGWEAPDCELRGHSVGHYLSGCALMYAATGDARFKDRAVGIVAELAKCQAALPGRGYNPGFLSAYPESFFDRVDQAKPVWAPYYTLHKIMAGLLDVHQLCGDAQSLEVLVKMADWLKRRVDRLSTAQMQRALGNEHGGMNEVLANLYAVTKNPDHLKLARAFNHEAIFNFLAQGHDQLDGKHANTQIPKIIGSAREYEVTGEKRFDDIAEFFWREVALKRSYAIGGHSDGEYFFPISQFAHHLGFATCETCNTYNMLKLTRHLFSWQPSAVYMDFYERALYNHILASQEPEQGGMLYFASLKPGHFKSYNSHDESFWCCTGTGMENHAKYGDTIYFHDADSLYVNLFIASELNWKERSLVIRQETDFPAQERTKLTFHGSEPQQFALKIRYPSWAERGIEVQVNGHKQEIVEKPGSYVSISRQWRDGDVVEVKLPMTLHIESLPGDPSQVAVLYGPIVLAGALGREGIEHISQIVPGQTDLAYVPTPAVPALVCSTSEIISGIVPVPGKPLTFKTTGICRPNDVTLIPFYQAYYQRYTVYWKVYSSRDWQKHESELAQADAERRRQEARIVDRVLPGNTQSETDHHLVGERTTSGDYLEHLWRHATDGGWFSYRLAVKDGSELVCKFWGSDAGNRNFDILIDDAKLATVRLENNKPDQFYDVVYKIPKNLLRDKQFVTVKFQAHDGALAGGLYEVKILRSEK